MEVEQRQHVQQNVLHEAIVQHERVHVQHVQHE